jgi:RNA polymerase sigma-70 factor (ECF subfamily)
VLNLLIVDTEEGPPTSELLERARGGDRAALEALLERFEPQLYRFGMRMCGDPEDARDVLQETMLAAARAIRDFRGASSISTWLYAIARSFCIKARRQGRSAKARPVPPEQLATAVDRAAEAPETPEEALATERTRAALEHAIGELEPMYREVLILRDGEGLGASEVAEVLGLSVAAVKSRLHRARRMVRDAMASAVGEKAEAADACPDVIDLYSRYVEGDIDATTCAAMEEHLGGCARCRARCDSLKEALRLCQTEKERDRVPPEVQRAVRRALDELLA